MKVITRKQLIKTVAERWKIQHGHNWNVFPYLYAERIYEQLKNLPKNSTREKVDEIIGSKSWTEIICDVCLEDVDKAINIECEFDYITATICIDCLKEGINLLEKYE